MDRLSVFNMADNNTRWNSRKQLSKCLLWMAISVTLWISTSSLGSNFEAAFQGNCAEKSPCEQTCFDLHDGTFECGCRDGYVLSYDGYSCKVAFNNSDNWQVEDWIVWNGSTPYHTSSKSVKFQMQQSDMHDFSSLHEMMDKLKIKFPRSHPRNSGVSEEEEDNDANSYQHFKEKINWEEDDRIRDVGGEQEDEEWKDDSEVDEGEDQKQYSYETSIDGNDYIDENEVLPLNKFRQSVEMSTMQLDDKISSSISSQHLPSFDSATTSPSSSPSVSQTPNDHDNSPRQAQEPDTLELLCERFQCEGDSVCVSDNEGGVVCLCPLGRGGDHCEKYVEVRFPKFRGQSHLQLPPLRNAYKDLQFTIEFRPEQTSGLLLYSGEQRDGSGDFASMAIVDGYVEFRFDCGSGIGLIRSKEKILLHSWNKVTVFRHRWDAWMQLNDGDHEQGRSKGLFSRITFKDHLFLGGVPHILSLSSKVNTQFGFTGCIRYMEINGHIYDFRPLPKGDANKGRGIGECSAEVCNDVECKNGGKCIANSADSALCLCPLGFGGDYCGTVVDLVMPSFNGTSYLKYPGLGSAFLSFIEILISFKPLDPDGLFFYNGFKTDGTGDFISLSLSGGFVELRFDLGNGPAIIRSMEPISLHEWHTVFLSRTGRAGLLEVDNQPRIEGLSKGAFTQLSLPQHLYIGGVPSFEIISHKVGVKSSFRGCVQKVDINGKQLKLFEAALVGVNVDNCNHPCVNRPCMNHGLCSPRKDSFTCHCLLGYADSRCQTEIRDNITFPMFMGNSFLRYNKLEILKKLVGSKFEIAFSMKTLSPNGLLLWIGQREMSSTSDFVALSLQNGFAHLRFNLGSGELILRDNSTRLDDGQWHSVKALRVEQKATLIIDDQPPVSGIAPGSLTQVNTDTGLYLGGVPDPAHTTLGKYSAGFVGCISELWLNSDQKVHLVSDAQGGLNIEACV